MSTQFTNRVGYRGLVVLNGVIVLATSGQYQKQYNPIFASGVWGAGYYNAAEQVAASKNRTDITGSFSIEMTDGSVFSQIEAFAFSGRGQYKWLYVLPDGKTGLKAPAWCTHVGFSCSQDANLTADINFETYVGAEAKGGDTCASAINSDNEDRLGASGGSIPFGELYPYWASSANVTLPSGVVTPTFISWNASYDSSLEKLGATTNEGNSEMAPAYIGLGTMNASGSIETFNSVSLKDATKIEFNLKSNGSQKVALAKVMCNSYSESVQTGSGFITGSYDFTVMGDGTQPPMALL